VGGSFPLRHHQPSPTTTASSDAISSDTLPKKRRIPVTRQEANEKAELYIVKNLPKLVSRLMELAMGVTMAKRGKDGNVNIYVEAPDRQAAEYLVERVMGKVPQRHEVTGDEGGPMKIMPWAPALPPALPPPTIVESLPEPYVEPQLIETREDRLVLVETITEEEANNVRPEETTGED